MDCAFGVRKHWRGFDETRLIQTNKGDRTTSEWDGGQQQKSSKRRLESLFISLPTDLWLCCCEFLPSTECQSVFLCEEWNFVIWNNCSITLIACVYKSAFMMPRRERFCAETRPPSFICMYAYIHVRKYSFVFIFWNTFSLSKYLSCLL